MKMRSTSFVLLALAAVHAGAQTVYKSVMPDGSVVYGNGPVKGATKVEPITVEPPVVTDSPAAPNPDAARRVREDRRSEDAAWAKAGDEIRSAEEALSAAKLAQQSGVAPLPGEMIGNAGNSFVRPSDAYFARQQQLADDVKKAQTKLDAAIAARNALR
jgi:Domain of unknown function (DUF4124)